MTAPRRPSPRDTILPLPSRRGPRPLGMAMLAAACLLSACRPGGAVGDEAPSSAAAPKAPAAPSPTPHAATPGTDWCRFLGPTGDSKSPERGIATSWGPHGPPLVWQRPLGAGYGIGAVARGRYYQFDRHGDQARLCCLDARTGELRWTFHYPTDFEDMLGYNDGPRSSPVVDDQRVYLFGAEGMLHCLAADTGTLVWKVDTARRFGVVQNFFGVGSTPAIEGDLLLVMVGGSPPSSQTAGRWDLDRVEANGTGIVAFDKRTGEVRYALGDELASYASPQLATIGGRRWCFAFARGGLVAFEPRSGTLDFHYPWRSRLRDSVNASTPVVVGDEVFISEAYGPGSSLLRVRPGGYDVVWRDAGRDKAMMAHMNTPIFHEGFLYGCSGRHSKESELRCIEWKTGKVRWSQPGLRWTSLLYVDGHFVCLSEDGVLRLLRATPDAYTELSRAVLRQTADGPPLLRTNAWAAPILAHGLLYLRDEHRLVCLQLLRPR